MHALLNAALHSMLVLICVLLVLFLFIKIN